MKKIWFITLIGFFGCVEETNSLYELQEGYTPLYGSATSSEIKIGPPITISNPGKIYSYNHLLFVNEHNLGVHIIDNATPAQPAQIAFIEILGNSDIVIKNDIMYADHMGNLVALKLNNFNSIEKVGELSLGNWLLGVPPPRNFNFECVDPEKGMVIGWRKEKLINWDCYAF